MSNLPWPLNSRKSIAALAGVIAAIVLLATEQIDAETAVQMITGLIMVLIGSIAWEDAAAKGGNSATVTLPTGPASTGTTTSEATITTTTSGTATPTEEPNPIGTGVTVGPADYRKLKITGVLYPVETAGNTDSGGPV